MKSHSRGEKVGKRKSLVEMYVSADYITSRKTIPDVQVVVLPYIKFFEYPCRYLELTESIMDEELFCL
jgi:hypothetical protein